MKKLFVAMLFLSGCWVNDMGPVPLDTDWVEKNNREDVCWSTCKKEVLDWKLRSHRYCYCVPYGSVGRGHLE